MTLKEFIEENTITKVGIIEDTLIQVSINGKLYGFDLSNNQLTDGLISDYVIEEYSHFWFITQEDFDKTID